MSLVLKLLSSNLLFVFSSMLGVTFCVAGFEHSAVAEAAPKESTRS